MTHKLEGDIEALGKIIAGFVTLMIIFSAFSANAQVRLPSVPAETPYVAVYVETRCESGRSVFKIINAGDEWSNTGEVLLVSEADNRIIAKREMRFKAGQVATYRLPHSVLAKSDVAEESVRLIVRAPWQPGGTIAETKLRCATS